LSLKNTGYLFGTAAIVALMAGCASKPQVTAQQESSGYLSRAHGDYRAPGPASDPWGPYIQEASGKYDVPDRWIRAVMHQESGGHLFNRGGELITSGAGAMGLMQVMPATYDDLRGRYRELGDDPYDPHNNIMAGTAYLREMYDIYGSPGFLAAYNAGPGRLDDYLTRNRTLPTETRRYVAAIGPRIAGYDPQRASPGAQYAMNSIPLDVPAGPRYPQLGTQFAQTLPLPSAAPIQVAEAPRPFITLNPPAPVVVADAAPRGPFITLNPPQPSFEPAPMPEPVVVADATPSPRYEAPHYEAPRYEAPRYEAPRYEALRYETPRYETPRYEADAPTRSLLGRSSIQSARAMPLPEPPPPPAPVQFARRAPQSFGRPIEVAEFPEPPRPPSQRGSAASELVALGPHMHGFGLISSANAAPMVHGMPAITAKGGAWAVQVGAFSNENLAHSATLSAREHARDVLGGAHTLVAGVHQPGGTLYRARLGGLSRDAANEACERLSRARTSCMIVSPDAQR